MHCVASNCKKSGLFPKNVMLFSKQLSLIKGKFSHRENLKMEFLPVACTCEVSFQATQPAMSSFAVTRDDHRKKKSQENLSVLIIQTHGSFCISLVDVLQERRGRNQEPHNLSPLYLLPFVELSAVFLVCQDGILVLFIFSLGAPLLEGVYTGIPFIISSWVSELFAMEDRACAR